MADELDDGEFWLPSHFLTDDDFLAAPSCPVHSKAVPLSTSPQSTLFGCDCNHYQGSGSASGSNSSHGSSPTKYDNKATLDLLNEAAGEVAKMKRRSDKGMIKGTSSGTGFFDCSLTVAKKKPLSPHQTIISKSSVLTPSVYFHPRFPPHMMWGPVLPLAPPQQQQKQQQQQQQNNNVNINNRQLGLPQAVWPPLQGLAEAQAQGWPVTSMFVGPSRETVGTGVFLPRRVGSPAESKKKSDGHTMKTKNNKSLKQQNSHSINANLDEIQLPSEWIY